jgi:hypothetical protein
MLAIRITGANLKTARQCLGWSLQEAAARSGEHELWLCYGWFTAPGFVWPLGESPMLAAAWRGRELSVTMTVVASAIRS